MEIIDKILKQRKTPVEFLKQGIQNVYSKYLKNESSIWNNMYKENYEDKMNSEQQKDRYIEIGEIVNKSGIGKSDILDIGSGNGTLTNYIDTKKINTFTGIDISKEAVKIANKKYETNENINFIETDILTFSGYKFDIIIFNESLYYFRLKDIEEVIERALDMLKEDGIMIISMSVSIKSYLIRKKLDLIFTPESDKKIYSRFSGNNWRIRVYKKN
ncbi:MAG TPA: class I SAM-dependent methyltransferase [Ignavibacteria bacterium]|nr:class I SAM-dependent methyltransferase [Ignavibacteria bacterium]